jgi:glycosyltransferase involved in cell wall biosynthesis
LSLKIAILGTRGIPNQYGGYEQAVTYLSPGLVRRGHAVTVYNSHNHAFTGDEWNGVQIVHCYDPEYRAGTAGQFIYDLNCLRHARKRGYDVILLMGYTSSSVWGKWYPKKSVTISNMDGLEWKRSKYRKPVRAYLRYAEKLAVKYSDYYVADSPAIKTYLDEKYKINSHYIPYGAFINEQPAESLLTEFSLQRDNYFLVVARLEPENNIETILDGFACSDTGKTLVVIGNTANKYGKKMLRKFNGHSNIRFIGSVFDQTKLDSLRSYCSLYFHGHSVGGTNPSLLEAMACRALIVAHDNPFNNAVLGNDAFYFSNAEDIANIINTNLQMAAIEGIKKQNLQKIREQYNWESVIDEYEKFIVHCHKGKKK